MSKEKVFGFVKKKKEEREKEVVRKCIIISLMTFTLIGILFIFDVISKLDIHQNFIVNGLAQWLIFITIVCSIIWIVFICAQLSTKEYKLKEIKK